MNDRAMDQIRHANPIPDELPPLPIEEMWQRIDALSPERRRGGRSGGLFGIRESLVRAAERSTPGRARHPGGGASWRSAARAVPTLAAVGVVLIVGFIALTALHHGTAPSRPPVPTDSASEKALRQILAVLRRPQTPADRAALGTHRMLGGRGPFSAVIPSTVRIARVTPWGQLAIVAVTKAWKPTPRSRSVRSGGLLFGVFNRGGGGGGGCCADAAGIEAQGALSTSGAGRAFAGGSTKTDLTLVVPDGVAKVTFVFPRQSAGNQYGAPVYPAPLRVTVPVIGNVAAVRVNRECCGGALPMIWSAADGRVVKQIGNFGGIGQVVPQPKPGPETAQSRAAEKDPSTPNPVWITPPVAGTRTKLTIHFRALLNGADYSWQVTGTRCPSFTPGGGEGDPNLLRGQLASFDLRSIANQALCPGTYQVSVTVMDLGRFGGHLRHPKPFGTGTFTVR